MTNLKRWVLRRRPEGEIAPGDLELVAAEDLSPERSTVGVIF